MFTRTRSASSKGAGYVLDRYGYARSGAGVDGTKSGAKLGSHNGSQNRTMWADDYPDNAMGTTFVSVGGKRDEKDPYVVSTSPKGGYSGRESQEHIIDKNGGTTGNGGSFGGITMTTDISLKSDQASDLEDAKGTKPYHAY